MAAQGRTTSGSRRVHPGEEGTDGMTIYELLPGSIAALLYVRPPGITGDSIACVYASKERGVRVGRFEKPLTETGWPAEVQAQITGHFDKVFALEHETWKGEGP